MQKQLSRRDFMQLAAAGGGVVFTSGLAGCASGGARPADDFFFVQMSDTHWGFTGAPNPEAKTTLKRAVAAVNALPVAPDFIVFTGDLTHTTDDGAERRRRLGEFRGIVADLKVKDLRFMPGEHDASLDRGAAYQEFFGETHYTFSHKGVNFVALDNVSDPGGAVGAEQLDWLGKHLSNLDKGARLVVLTHRPLFDLAPRWDWATRDGAKVVDLLMPFPNVTVFYGHIHQEHHHMTAHIAHHAAKSLIFALPAPMSKPARTPQAWDPAQPFAGLGFRGINSPAGSAPMVLTENTLKA